MLLEGSPDLGMVWLGSGYGVALWSFGEGKGMGEKAGRKVHSLGKK